MKRFLFTVLAFELLFLAVHVHAAAPNLLAGIPFTFGKQAIVAVALAKHPGGNAPVLKIVIAHPSVPDYDQQASAVLPMAVPDGDVLRLHFWARSPTRNHVRAVYEKDGEPYDKSLQQSFRPTPQWQEYAFTFTSPAYAAQGAAVRFVVGQDAGTVELTGIDLEDYGVHPAAQPPNINLDPYGGASHNELWRPAAEARIRRIRMGNLVVHVVDDDGRPVPGALVHVKQTRHAFRFGTALAYEPLFAQTPDGAKYRQTVLKLFNYVVLENALKWGAYGGDFGPADKMLTWCAEHNLPVRGHNLFWPSYKWLPEDVRGLRGQAMRDAVHSHITDYVSRTRGRVVVWDVVNEAVTSHEVYDEAGKDLIAEAFKWAHQANPNILLAYNDNTIFDMQGGTQGVHDKDVDAILHYLIDNQHAPVTDLGIQSHMGNGAPLVPAAYLLHNLDHWATYKLPIEITEFDASILDDNVQAQYMDDFMTAVFSHPQVSSFVMWGFWAGSHWMAAQGGAMIRRDWTPRPAERVYERLVFHDWWTDVNGRAHTDGSFRTRAFLGDYTITASKNGKTAAVSASVITNEDSKTVVQVTL